MSSSVPQHRFLAEAAAILPGAAGVAEQLLALNEHARQILPSLHGRPSHVRGRRGGGRAIETRQCPIPAGGIEDARHRAPIAVRSLEVHQVEHSRFSLYPLGNRIRERAEDQWNDEMADDVTTARGEGMMRIEHAAGGRRYADRLHRACIVRDFRGCDALDGVNRHRACVAERHVDALVYRWTAAREIDLCSPVSGELYLAGELKRDTDAFGRY